jgi:hypothetical protein
VPWPAQEVVDQVVLKRTRPAASGHLHFSMVALMQDREGLGGLLRAGPYTQPALVPVAPWLGGQAPAAPARRARRRRAAAARGRRDGCRSGYGALRVGALAARGRAAGSSTRGLPPPLPRPTRSRWPPARRPPVVSAVDRQGLESPRVRVALG